MAAKFTQEEIESMWHFVTEVYESMRLLEMYTVLHEFTVGQRNEAAYAIFKDLAGDAHGIMLEIIPTISKAEYEATIIINEIFRKSNEDDSEAQS